jgi:uncharacterized coiled-coil protein SlyX
MMFLARWRLWGGLLAGILLAGYIGALNVSIAHERTIVSRLSNDLAVAQGQTRQCAARLDNLLERIKSDASVPDDLGGFDVPPDWLLPDP